jgi:hypothetical protein
MANFQQTVQLNLCKCPLSNLISECDLYKKDHLTDRDGRCTYRIDKGMFYLCVAGGDKTDG